MELLVQALTVTYILEVWFNTDAFIEYMRLIRLTKFFYLKEYLENFHGHMTYLDYLLEYRDCFFVRLISCPTCLSFWLSVMVSFIYGNLLDSLATAFLSLIFLKCLSKLTSTRST